MNSTAWIHVRIFWGILTQEQNCRGMRHALNLINCFQFFRMMAQIYILTCMHKLMFYQHLAWPCFLIFISLIGAKWHLIVLLSLYFSDYGSVWASLHMLINLLGLLVCTLLVNIICSFFYWTCWFFCCLLARVLIYFRYSLLVLDIESIFSNFILFLLVLSMVFYVK